MNISTIEINNNVLLNELYDNKTWIHGTNRENIKITIFLITIEGYQLKYALEAINRLHTTIPVLVSVVMNISPTSKAYNTMRLRCNTEYFIQLDEDMELYANTIELMYESISNKCNKIYCFSYYLIDEYLGIGQKKYLEGIKLYNYSIMKHFPTSENPDKSTSSVDRNWHKSIEKFGYTHILVPRATGFHALHRKPFDLMLRFCKSTQSFSNDTIKKNSGDICRFIKPINYIQNFYSYFNSIIQHFIHYKPIFQKKKLIFHNNYKIMRNSCNRYVACQILKEYNLPTETLILNDTYTISEKFDEEFYNFLFTCNIIKIFDIFCIVGIINTLFENYEYSYKQYPYDIYEYFLKIFEFRLCIVSDNIGVRDYFKKHFELYDCIKIVHDKNIDFIDCIVENCNLETQEFTIDNKLIKFHDIDEMKRVILDRKRKHKLFP